MTCNGADMETYSNLQDSPVGYGRLLWFHGRKGLGEHTAAKFKTPKSRTKQFVPTNFGTLSPKYTVS